MSQEALAATEQHDGGVAAEPLVLGAEAGRSRGAAARGLDVLVRSIGPVILALACGALLLVALGRDPGSFYGSVLEGGLSRGNWQDTVIRMAPLLLIAVGFIVVFRAGVWNMGFDGQFLLAAAVIAGYGPQLDSIPTLPLLAGLFVVAALVGALWTALPALLKARYNVNEVISTLMMSSLAIGLVNVLVKGPFQDPKSIVPQTRLLPLSSMLPALPGTRVNVGILVTLAVVLVAHFILTRTAVGLRLEVIGVSRASAVHAGINVRRVIFVSFLVSGGLIGMAAAPEILGVWGYMRAEWNPEYGAAVIPFVFLARLNVLAAVPFIAFYSLLSVGGDLAARKEELPTDFMLVIVALILLFMALTEYLGKQRDLGESYMTEGLTRIWRRRRA